jgi:hypothetical protein
MDASEDTAASGRADAAAADTHRPSDAAPAGSGEEGAVGGQRALRGHANGVEPPADPGGIDLYTAAARLRAEVAALGLGLRAPGVARARRARGELLRQLDDYVLPRLQRMDAPLLAVIGGSTGAGKSTLTNSLVRRDVSRAGVLRPTTRAPVLVHHPFDSGAFMSQRILPGLARITSEAPERAEPVDVDAPPVTTLRLVPDERMAPGLAIIDAPDIDSVVEANRDLAVQMFGAADLWIFVTTAARYADAMPWTMLQQAQERGTAVAVVLDRVPPDVMNEVRVHLATLLRDRGLANSPMFTIPEVEMAGGFLAEPLVAPLFGWLTKLARDQRARDVVVRRTLSGVVASLGSRTEALAAAADIQDLAYSALSTNLSQVFDQARADLLRRLGDGTVLRGDVLARWNELVGGGDLSRSVDSIAGRLRERLSAAFAGHPAPIDELATAIGAGAAALIEAETQTALERATSRWRSQPAGVALLRGRTEMEALSHDFRARLTDGVNQWQADVIELVRSEARDRKVNARVPPYGAEATAVLLTLVSLGTDPAKARAAPKPEAAAVVSVARALVAAAFGGEGVRSMAATVRSDLARRGERLVEGERARLVAVLASAGVRSGSGPALRSCVLAMEEAR